MKQMWDLILVLVVLAFGVFTQLSIVCWVGIALTVTYVLMANIGRYLLARETRRRLTPKGVKELLHVYDTQTLSPEQTLLKYLILICMVIVLFYDTRVLMGDWVLFISILALAEIPLDFIGCLTLRRRIVRRLKTVTRQFEAAGLIRTGPHDFEVKREVRI